MNRPTRSLIGTLAATLAALIFATALMGLSQQAPSAVRAPRVMSADDCTASQLGTTIPVSSIGEAVAGVTLAAPRWVAATDNAPAYCSIDGVMAPTDTSSNGRPINFRVVLPASWTSHAVQLGGGGMNGSIPNLTGGEAATLLQRGFATYGSDSGHQQAFGPRGAAPAGPSNDDWTLSDEAIKNLGYMQLKKTHDAAMVLIERLYGERPRFNYFCRHVPEWTRSAHRRAALSSRLQRHCGECADRELLFPHACSRVDPHPGKARGQLGHAGKSRGHSRRIHKAV